MGCAHESYVSMAVELFRIGGVDIVNNDSSCIFRACVNSWLLVALGPYVDSCQDL